MVPFPGNERLHRSGISVQGVDLIRSCMAPDPASRPSATAAIEAKDWVMRSANLYENWALKRIREKAIIALGNQPHSHVRGRFSLCDTRGMRVYRRQCVAVGGKHQLLGQATDAQGRPSQYKT